MTDTVENVELPYDEGDSKQEKLDSLREQLETIEAQNEEMRDKLLDANAENNKYQQKLERLTRTRSSSSRRCSSRRSKS